MSESTPFVPPARPANPFASAQIGEMAPVAPTPAAVVTTSSEVTQSREANPKAHILEISNFQSIKEQTFILQGFVTIQGNSDLGKSAIVRALRALINNDWQPDWLRDGEKLCTISLYFSLEMVAQHGISAVHLYKSKTRNEYIVEFEDKPAKSYPKIGREVPQELKQLGFGPVATDRGDSFNLNVQKQHKPLFLVSNTGVELTSFFNALFQIDKYEKANRTVNADTLELQRSINYKTDLTQQKDIALKNLRADLPLLEQEAEKAEKAEKALSLLLTQAKTISQATQALEDLETSARTQSTKSAQLQAALFYAQTLEQTLAKLGSVRTGIRMLSSMESELSSLSQQGASATSAKTFIDSFDQNLLSLSQIRSIRESWESLEARNTSLQGKAQAAAPALQVLEVSGGVLERVIYIRNAIQALSEQEAQLITLRQGLNAIQTSALAPLEEAIRKAEIVAGAQSTLTPLRNAIKTISGLEAQVVAPKASVAAMLEVSEYINSTLSNFSQYLPVCETCGQNLPQHTH